jgi:MAM domain.
MKRLVVSVFLLFFLHQITLAQCSDTLSLFPINYDIQGEAPCPTGCQSPCPLSGDWINSISDGTDWTVNFTGTSSGATGPLNDNTFQDPGGLYLYVETSSPCSGGIEAILESQCINLDSIGAPFISFYYHMYGATMGDLYLEIYDGSTWSLLLALSGQQQIAQTDGWIMADVDLTSYSGIVQLRFRGVTGTSYTSDMAIDDIKIYDKIPNDVGAVVLSTPLSGCGLTIQKM